MKKIIILLLLLLIPVKVNANELAKNSVSSILMEYSSGNILYENNSDEELSPASMTKVMTMLLIMEALEDEKIKLSDMVVVSPNAARMGGSQVFLEAGSSMSVEELLKAIAIASANDASVALAEHISGSTTAFVAKMNEKCRAIGCTNTNFMNVHGLDESSHYSSAKDMARISRELLKHKDVLKYTTIYEEYLNKPDGTSTWMVNTNKLIRYYSGVDGLKTGFTSDAGYCLSASAERNNMRLISVVMKAPTTKARTDDTVELLNYGFGNFKIKIILDTKADLGKLEVIGGKEKTVNLKLTKDATNLE
ncbi:MAG TPA: D-alanyl-D-alanine carboxypeptidase, partial [Mollicutes bacterium]|nr:D-alanyl-D-alanine carboxypeptidase [Mollicutes bacterium]